MRTLSHARPALWLSAAVAVAGAASAQNFNIDVGADFGTPSAAYAAGAGQAGTWNNVDGSSIGTVFALLDLSGGATAASVSYQLFGNGAGNFSFDDPNTTGDDQALMDDLQDIGSGTSLAIWTFSGLNQRTYAVYTYAWAPDDPINSLSKVSVTGSGDPAQTLGGNWTGSHAQGVTYALHTVSVGASGQIQVQVQPAGGYGSVNGFQIVEGGSGPPSTFCTSLPTSLAGCTPALSGTSTSVSKSAGAGSYALSAAPVPGGAQAGVFIWAKSTIANPVFKDPNLTQANGGGFGWRCIVPIRGTPDLPGGTAGNCNGQYDWDLGAYVGGAGSGPIAVGDNLYIQGWFRDPGYAAGALFTQGVGPVAVTP